MIAKALRWAPGTGAALASVLIVAGCGSSSSTTTSSGATAAPPATELVLAQADMPSGWSVSRAAVAGVPDRARIVFSYGAQSSRDGEPRLPALSQVLQVFTTPAEATRQFHHDSNAVPAALTDATSGTAVEPLHFATSCDQQTASTMSSPDRARSATRIVCRIGNVEFVIMSIQAPPVGTEQSESIATTAAQKVKAKTS